MRKGLGKIAEVLSTRPDRLRIKPEVIGIAHGFFEEQPSLVEFASTGQAFGIPERTSRKGTVLPAQFVRPGLGVTRSVHQRIVKQRASNGVQGRQPPWIRRADKFNQWHQQRSGI